TGARLAIFEDSEFATKQLFLDAGEPTRLEFGQPARRLGFVTRRQQKQLAPDSNQGSRKKATSPHRLILFSSRETAISVLA
ncbi:MAG: hypothetical protein DME32_13030, partial [Verrucomicrobia bacterium]